MKALSTTDFFQYKCLKAARDWKRLHDLLAAAGITHVGTWRVPDAPTLGEFRFAIDDLLADLSAAWDSLLAVALAERGISLKIPPTHEERKIALAELATVDSAAHDEINNAYDGLFRALKKARNYAQHAGFWKGGGGDDGIPGPFPIELRIDIETNGAPRCHVLREAQVALLWLEVWAPTITRIPLFPNSLIACELCLIVWGSPGPALDGVAGGLSKPALKTALGQITMKFRQSMPVAADLPIAK